MRVRDQIAIEAVFRERIGDSSLGLSVRVIMRGIRSRQGMSKSLRGAISLDILSGASPGCCGDSEGKITAFAHKGQPEKPLDSFIVAPDRCNLL